jgi:hypothetical protein
MAHRIENRQRNQRGDLGQPVLAEFAFQYGLEQRCQAFRGLQ